MDAAGRCPVCGGALERFLRIERVPVFTTVLWPSAAQARDAPRGDLDLAVCTSCALVRNVAFDPALVEYSPDYENSQHFSPTFHQYAEALAARLATDHDLAGGVVVDIGSGKGEFLSLLCSVADCKGYGFDPSYDGEVDDQSGRVTFVRELFGTATHTVDADLVCCRHVLEHVEDPLSFLGDVAAAIEPGTPVYFEVPNGAFVMTPSGMWDLIYQHVSYFTPAAMTLAFERAGLGPVAVRTAFEDQFLYAESLSGVAQEPVDVPSAEGLLRSTRELSSSYEATRHRWQQVLREVRGGAVLWGAGAKGVGFLNSVAAPGDISAVVDVNVRKHGRFVPGTAHEVAPPESLEGADVGAVLVMNRAYEREIRAQLDELGLAPEVLCV